MKFIQSSNLSFVPASHENPNDPGVYKKILFKRDDLPNGVIQMINWGKLPSGKYFQKHFHEDMFEIFILTSGVSTMSIDSQFITLQEGDAVVIDPKSVHSMKNISKGDVAYIVIGITLDQGGKTIIVENG